MERLETSKIKTLNEIHEQYFPRLQKKKRESKQPSERRYFEGHVNAKIIRLNELSFSSALNDRKRALLNAELSRLNKVDYDQMLKAYNKLELIFFNDIQILLNDNPFPIVIKQLRKGCDGNIKRKIKELLKDYSLEDKTKEDVMDHIDFMEKNNMIPKFNVGY